MIVDDANQARIFTKYPAASICFNQSCSFNLQNASSIKGKDWCLFFLLKTNLKKRPNPRMRRSVHWFPARHTYLNIGHKYILFLSSAISQTAGHCSFLVNVTHKEIYSIFVWDCYRLMHTWCFSEYVQQQDGVNVTESEVQGSGGPVQWCGSLTRFSCWTQELQSLISRFSLGNYQREQKRQKPTKNLLLFDTQ